MTRNGKTRIMPPEHTHIDVHPPRTADLKHLDAYLRHLALAGHPKTTVDTYRSILRQAVAQLPDGLLATPEEILGWLATRPGRNTRATYATGLGGFYEWCVRTRRLAADDNPMLEVPQQKRSRGLPRPCTHEQLALILTTAADPFRLWSHVFAYAGARCVEVSRLRREHITPEVTYLHGKGDKERAVPTHPELWRAVADLPPGPLATCSAGQISRRSSREFTRLGLADVTAHRLRHWYGTYVQAAAGDTRVTQELLGHASVSTTQVYTLVSQASMRAAVLALPSLSGGAATAGGAAGG